MREREISLADLCIEILLRWRMFIVWMLCGAVLLGGFSYVRSWRSASAQAAQVEEAKRQLEAEASGDAQVEQDSVDPELVQWAMEQLSETQLRNVEYVLAYEKLYINQLAYQKQSVLMQLDADNIYRAEVTFYISSESMERSYSIEGVYEDIVKGGGLVQYVADQLNMSSSVVSEVIALRAKERYLNDGSDSFTLIISHYDEQVCQEIARVVTQFVESKYQELVSIFGQYKITVLNQTVAVVSDQNIANYQKNFLNNIISMQDTIEKRKDSFSDEEWQYYDIMINGEITGIDSSGTVPESPAAIVSRGVTVTPQVSVKYVILGMVLAVFCYTFFILIVYVFNTKIRMTESLQQIYSIPQLGLIPDEGKKKKFLGIVDQWIWVLRNRNKRKFTEEEAIKLATVAVKMKAEREALDSVYIIGCNLKERTISVCEQLKESLAQNKIQVSVLNNVLYDAQAMNDLENAKGVVLVERAGSTFYEEISQELELLNRQGIIVLGGIIVE